MKGPHRIIERSVAIVSVAAIATTIGLARPSHLLIAAIVIVAMAWGAAPQAIGALFGQPGRSPPPDEASGTFTVIVVVDREPIEVCRVGIAAAAASAPTLVVTTNADVVAELGRITVPVLVDRSVELAINRAAVMVDTDAVIVVSASSFVDARAAESASGLVGAGAGWVVGHSHAFNRDGFTPLVRERLGTRLRTSARAVGVHLWEPDATVVATRLVREHPFVPGRPWGATLRSSAARGCVGVERDMTLSMTAEPVDARSYWPASVLRRRRAVADLADAAKTCRGRPRWLAIGLLLRELDGCVLTLWLITPWLITRTDVLAFRCPLWALVVLTCAPALLRSVAMRLAHGVRVHPLEDTLALAFDAPGSVLAIPAAVTRRVAPTRLPLPGQPLVLAGLVFAGITAVPLFTEGTTAKRGAAVGLALTEMALLWLLAMRAIFQRNWARTMYRVRAPLAARVDGRPATTLDVSPTGLALEGRFNDVLVGSDVAIEISLDDGSTLSARGTVGDDRARGDAHVVGVSLRVRPVDRSRWVAQLSRSVALSSSRPMGAPRSAGSAARREQVTHRLLGRVIVVAISLVSLTALVALCLAVVGFRPLIVRSGSMEPALRVGDVVLVEDVEVRDLAVGDIATFRGVADTGDSLTHRVRAVVQSGKLVTVTTRGDANVSDETFTMRADDLVGRVASRLAGVGSWVAWAGRSWTRWTGAIVGVAISAGVLLRGRRKQRAPIRTRESIAVG